MNLKKGILSTLAMGLVFTGIISMTSISNATTCHQIKIKH